MLNKIVSFYFSTWWMGYLVVVNQLDILRLFHLFVPTSGIVATLASLGTIAVLSLYFFVLMMKVVIPLAYFALSFSFYFKLISFGFVSSGVYFSFAFVSLHGIELYFQMLQMKLYWLLFLIYKEVKTLGFLLELVMETIEPLFSKLLLDSGDPSFNPNDTYQKIAQEFFELGVEPLKFVSAKLKAYVKFFKSFKKQQEPIVVKEPIVVPSFLFETEMEQVFGEFCNIDENNTIDIIVKKEKVNNFLFKMEMGQVFGEFCNIDENNVIEFPFHGFGILLFLGLRCYLIKKNK